MLIKYKHTCYFPASDEEFLRFDDLAQIYEHCLNKKGADGFGGVELAVAVSRAFFGDEKHVPVEIENNIQDVLRVFCYSRDFIEKLSGFERSEMDSFAFQLREDEFCRRNGFVGMGIWNFLYELYDCCAFAVKEKKNLYLIEENNEYVLER